MSHNADNVTEMIAENRKRDYWMSFAPTPTWRNRLDAQQALLELWFRDDWPRFKHLFRTFEDVHEQSEQFFRILDANYEQIRASLAEKLPAKQQAQFEDAILNLGRILLNPESLDRNKALDVPPDQRSHKKIHDWSYISNWGLERPILEKLVAHFLLGNGVAIWHDTTLPKGEGRNLPDKSIPETARLAIQERMRELEAEADSQLELAKMPIPQLQSLGREGWLWASWELFAAHYPWPETFISGGSNSFYPSFCIRSQSIPLGLAEDDRALLLKEEAEQYQVLGKDRAWSLRTPGPGRDAEVQDWVEDVVVRIKKALSLNTEAITLQDICKPHVNGIVWKMRGCPERWNLYAALFEHLLITPLEWLIGEYTVTQKPPQYEPQRGKEKLKEIPVWPENTVLFRNRWIPLSANEYHFLKACAGLKAGENLDQKLSIKLKPKAKDTLKNKIAQKFQVDKSEIFIAGCHVLQTKMMDILKLG